MLGGRGVAVSGAARGRDVPSLGQCRPRPSWPVRGAGIVVPSVAASTESTWGTFVSALPCTS